MRTFTNQNVSGIAALLHSLFGFITLFIVLYSLGIAPNPSFIPDCFSIGDNLVAVVGENFIE